MVRRGRARRGVSPCAPGPASVSGVFWPPRPSSPWRRPALPRARATTLPRRQGPDRQRAGVRGRRASTARAATHPVRARARVAAGDVRRRRRSSRSRSAKASTDRRRRRCPRDGLVVVPRERRSRRRPRRSCARRHARRHPGPRDRRAARAIDHALVLGVPVGGSRTLHLTAGLGRPLVLTNLDRPKRSGCSVAPSTGPGSRPSSSRRVVARHRRRGLGRHRSAHMIGA